MASREAARKRHDEKREASWCACNLVVVLKGWFFKPVAFPCVVVVKVSVSLSLCFSVSVILAVSFSHFRAYVSPSLSLFSLHLVLCLYADCFAPHFLSPFVDLKVTALPDSVMSSTQCRLATLFLDWRYCRVVAALQSLCRDKRLPSRQRKMPLQPALIYLRSLLSKCRSLSSRICIQKYPSFTLLYRRRNHHYNHINRVALLVTIQFTAAWLALADLTPRPSVAVWCLRFMRLTSCQP